MSAFWKLFFLVVTISGCAKDKGGDKVQIEEKPWVGHCIGRNMIKVPTSFIASPASSGIFKEKTLADDDAPFDITVRDINLSKNQFAIEISKRRIQLSRSSTETVDVFESERKLGDDATIFRVREIDDAYTSELHLLRGGSFISVRLDSYNKTFLMAEERLIKLAANIREHQKNGLRSRSTFCLGSVVLLGDYAHEYANYSFKNLEGLTIHLNVDTYTPDDHVSLLKRMSGPGSLLAKFDVQHTVLRKGERQLVGMRAQEWLGWAKLDDDADAKAIKFVLETMRERPGIASPHIGITLDSAQPLEDGSPTKTTITDEQAIRLWDSILNSINVIPME